MALIAKVNVVTMVDGERKEFAPGETLPKLSDHDVGSLKAMGAIEDTADTEKASKAAAAAEKQTAKEFAAARQSVQAAQASTETGAA